MKYLGLLSIFFFCFCYSVRSQDTTSSAFLLPVTYDTSAQQTQQEQQTQQAQQIIPDPYLFIDRYRVIESRDDSVFIWERFVNYHTTWELDEIESIVESYLSFDDKTIHYSPRFDASKKKDTTLIYLLDSGDYVHPFCNIVTSRFGPRRRRYHYGTDVDLNTGDTVRSAFDGTVRIAKYNRSYGYLVIVRHYNGLETYYAHLSKLLVQPDTKIKAGEPIGLGGNTGRSRGSHLHWEIRYLGAPLNPEMVVDFANCRLKSDTLYLSRSLFPYLGSGIAGSGVSYHRIRSGETLSSIARRYGTSVSNLQRLNRMGNSSTIRVGNSLRVR
ncbi:MAG: peptidoglycan DD-metalloendopeptidase family protein [Bacteroidales bacterium]|jgi:murein DD-endopeptidase MepM/ murein hydrolase activator NlpD|nr:peptidoglycan DD-metalloendopeptidase family protein [Bacteroidales bacterium]